MVLCIGIDPSLNSTGICLVNYDPSIDEENGIHFGIIHSDKLTKKESKAEKKYQDIFKYYIIEGLPKNAAKLLEVDKFEYLKTIKFKSIVDTIKEIIKLAKYNYSYTSIYVCIEGISYGSTGQTKSVFDLAGLNYMIRMMLLNSFKDEINLIIAPPTHVKKFATAKGNAKKDEMIDAFKIAFPNIDLPKLDDIADAFFMKEMAKKDAKDNY